ncbi:MAG: hypothetical protein Q9213_006371, partial [Squamulea squamosa]
IPGRILLPFLAPKLGTFNLTILTMLLNSLTTFTIWLPSNNHHNLPTIIIFTLLYGFFSGAYIALAPMLVAQISKIQQIGVRSGVLFFLVSLAALTGAPAGGVLIGRGGGGFAGLQILVGVCMGVAAGIMGVARGFVLGEKVRRV